MLLGAPKCQNAHPTTATKQNNSETTKENGRNMLRKWEVASRSMK
jgi:hypothetical protein